MPATAPTAANIMQRDVIVVYQNDTLQEAMSLMTQNHVTGLPVVNSKSKCVGIVTASDILNYEQDHPEYHEANSDMAQHFDPETERWESVRVSSFALEEFGDVHVEEVMSTELVSVHTDASATEVAKKMIQEGIHRVLVLDDNFRLYGIITSMDIVRLYAES